MALALGMNAGDRVRIGARTYSLDDIVSPEEYVVRDEESGREHVVTDAKAVEVAPDVFLSAGSRATVYLARLVIDAPREVEVDRIRP